MIEIKEYSKIIKEKKILDHVDYKFEAGKIYGLHGRNGSGKTMLIRAIAGLIYPTTGKIVVNGKVLHEEISFPENMGIIIENVNMYPMYDSVTNLKILANIRRKIGIDEIKNTLQRVGLNPDDKTKVGRYSLGMKQKLAIAQAIMEDPELLLLDEPTNALDEESVQLIRQILIEKRENGATIIIASHNKEDLEVLSDEILEMRDGKLLLR